MAGRNNLEPALADVCINDVKAECKHHHPRPPGLLALK